MLTSQLQDQNGCLGAALEQVETLRNHMQEMGIGRREMEQKIQELRIESQEAKTALDESLKGNNRYRCSLELITRYILTMQSLYFLTIVSGLIGLWVKSSYFY